MWNSAKDMRLQLPAKERAEHLGENLGVAGIAVGAIIGILVVPFLHILRIRSEAIATVFVFALTGAGYFFFSRLPRYIGDSASADLLGWIECRALRHHDLKPDGAFLSNGCECVRCHYRPKGRALMKLRG